MSISAAESTVMEALWRRSPLTAEEIIAEVAGPNDWSEATVKTLLNRLLTKQVIAADRDGRRYAYRPLVDRDAYVDAESRNLLDRLFDGSLASLMSHFSEREQLSAKEIAELKRLITEIDKNER